MEILKAWFQENDGDLFRFLYKMSGDQDLAKDIMQETFIRAYLKFHLFDSARGTLKNWLFRVALNLLRDHERIRKQRYPDPAEVGAGTRGSCRASAEV